MSIKDHMDTSPFICIVPSNPLVAYGPFSAEDAAMFIDDWASIGFVAVPCVSQPIQKLTKKY